MSENSLRLLITEESEHSPRFYEFDVFRLDAVARLLWRGGEIVRLMPKAFDVMLTLVRRHGEVVTKDELLANVWRDAVVEENSLNVNVSALRKVFGEKPREHRFIVTVPGVGYKFVADVREVFADEKEDGTEDNRQESNAEIFVVEKSAAPTALEATGEAETINIVEHPISNAGYFFNGIKQHKTGAIVGSLVLLLVLGGAYAAYRFVALTKMPVAHFQNVKLTRLTSEGTLASVTISPDGKYIAYILAEDGKFSLWTKHLATDSRVQIVAPVDANEMDVDTFSPDGNYVLYSVCDEQNPLCATYQVPVLGGASRKILTDVESTSTFSPDGKQIAFGRHRTGPGEDEYLTANADGTNQRSLITLHEPEGLSFEGASWSPDGKTIVLGYSSGAGVEQMFVGSVSVADGTLKPLSPKRWPQVGKVMWLNDGSGLVLLAREQPTDPLQIWRVSYPGGEVQRITNDLNSYASASLMLAADSSALVALQEDESSSIWLAPSGDVGRARNISTRKSAKDGIGGLAWDSDGRLIYASRINNNKSEIWMTDANGGNPKMLMEGDAIGSLGLSPDNRYLFFISPRSGSLQVWRTNLDGGDAKQLTDSTQGVFRATISPDGLSVIYSRFDLSLWKASIDGGAPVRLSDGETLRPRISPDGKLLAFLNLNEQKRNQLKVIPLDGDGDKSLSKSFDLPDAIYDMAFRWSPDGHALMYVVTKGGVSNLWRQPLDGGAPKQITNFNSERIWDFAYSRDGRQLALARGETTRDAVLISDVR
ncbi:MAG TPA: winged helix-turn-helix domain-containing protein [Pyrinomonadaceae bacterium]|nr:winged helix-turn-helix domain-containing protein [Pyrinomonadaceae bacterium]